MKKLPILLILLIVGSLDVRAQFFNSNELTSNPFSLLYGVDPQLTLFTPDTGAQILYNPARAMSYQRQFVVGKYDGYPQYNYFSYGNDVLFSETENNIRVTIERLSPPTTYVYVPSPTIDMAVLKRSDDGYWLIQFANIVNGSGNKSNSTSSRIILTTQTNSSVRSSEIDNSFSKTRLKISKIFSLGERMYSYSLFGFYLPNTQQSILSSSEMERTENTNNVYSRTNTSSLNGKQADPKYAVGIEMSFADNVSDLLVLLQVTKGKSEHIDETVSEYKYSYRYTDSINNSNSNNSTLSAHTYRSVLDPTSINISGYYHRALSLFGIPSGGFISVNAEYLYGDISLSTKRRNYSYSRYGNSNPTGDTSFTEASGNIESSNSGMHLSAGVISGFDLEDLKVQTGLVPQLFYSTSTNGQIGYYFSNEQTLTKYDNTYYKYEILIPLMIEYSPSEWCTIFSGMNTRYSIYTNDSEYKSLPLTTFYVSSSGGTSNQSLTTQNNGRSSNTNYYSSTSLFFNAQLQHRSGLKFQFSFKEDISKFKELGLSILYFF
ncbi:MAG: hypothetical protein WCX28_14570 [Bacteriovoracaceae bacterium]|nr:hypothetical protein [Bacteroidota bacterium]